MTFPFSLASDLPISPLDWILASLIILIGATIQGVIGYGVAVLGAPLLFLIHPAFVPGPMLMIGMLLPLMILIRDYHSVRPRDVGWALPGSAIGIAAASLIMGSVSERYMGLLLGTLVLISVGISLLHRFPPPRPGTISLGAAVSGFMATITSIGGPPLALVFQNVHGPRLPGTLSAIFVPGGILSLAALHWAGRFGWKEFVLGSTLLPAIILGYAASGKLNRSLHPNLLRPMVLTVSTGAAILILLQNWQA